MVLWLGEPRRLRIAEQIERLAEDAGLDLRLLVPLLRLLHEIGHALFQAVEIGEHQLGLDRLGVGDGIDPAFDMGDVAALETAQDMDDRVDLADIAEELVAEPLAGRGAAHQPGDIDELELRFDHLRRLRDLGEPAQARIGNRDAADIGLDRAEWIIGRLRRRRFGQRIEQGGLADIRQPDDPATKAHELPFHIPPRPAAAGGKISGPVSGCAPALPA